MNRNQVALTCYLLVLACALATPARGGEPTDQLATNFTLFVGRPASETGKSATQLAPGLALIDPEQVADPTATIEELKKNLKRTFDLAEITSTPAMVLQLTIGKETKLATPAGSVEFAVTLERFDTWTATYLVKLLEEGQPSKDTRVMIKRAERGLIGGRDGAAAPFFTLAIEPCSPTHRLKGDVVPPTLVSKAKPIYPEDARSERVQGVIILEAQVDTQGRVAAVRAIKGDDQRLVDAATAALKQWTYTPATLRGKPVAVYLTVTMKFSLQ